jgi:hypothetical protein
MSSNLLCRVAWYEFTDVSEVLTAITRGIIRGLIMEVVSTSETSVNLYRLRGTTTQKTTIFILATSESEISQKLFAKLLVVSCRSLP